jgi:hypothetical protein
MSRGLYLGYTIKKLGNTNIEKVHLRHLGYLHALEIRGRYLVNPKEVVTTTYEKDSKQTGGYDPIGQVWR